MQGLRPIQLLEELVLINSVFPNESRLAEYCAKFLRECDFQVSLQEYSPGRFNVIAQKGPRQGSVLLTAHLDTVPPYNYGSRDPLRLVRRDGRIFGLGVWDMKSGLALLLACAKSCNVSSRGLRIVLTSDEENISEGTWAAHKAGEFSGCGIAICHEIPDVPEGIPKGLRPPLLVGRRGRCVYRFHIQGIGAHGAGTGGQSALRMGMQLSLALEKVPMPQGKTGSCRLFMRSFHSESTSLAMPIEATLEADVHYVPPYTKETFLSYLREQLSSLQFPEGCGWSIEIPDRRIPYLPAYETSPENPQASMLLAAYSREIGEYSLSYGLTVADENILSIGGMPVVTIGLAGGEAHSSGEWVSEEDYLLLFERMPKIIQRLLV